MADEGMRPIVVKRIKKVAAGHHGGAWKIAYADFVTAMMAFFLLMWLLGSTAKGDLEGISEYFKTPLKVAMAGGSGAGDSSSVIKGGGTDLTRRNGQVKKGDIDPSSKTYNLEAAKAAVARSAARSQLLSPEPEPPSIATFSGFLKCSAMPSRSPLEVEPSSHMSRKKAIIAVTKSA